MKSVEQNNTQRSTLDLDTTTLNEIVGQTSSLTSRSTTSASRSTTSDIERPITSNDPYRKVLIINYAVQRLRQRSSTTEADSNSGFFIDTRKQEIFDWTTNNIAYQRLIHLSDLKNGWDGYNAPQFFKQQIDRALTLYSETRTYYIKKGLSFPKNEPFVAPCSDGSILFEWAGRRFPIKQLEVFVPRKTEELFEYLKTEGESEEEGRMHLNALRPMLDWLIRT